jgi:hypothetical protein
MLAILLVWIFLLIFIRVYLCLFIFIYEFIKWDNWVSEVTNCGLDGQGSISSRSRNVSLRHRILLALSSTPACYPLGTRALCLGLRLSERAVFKSAMSSTEVSGSVEFDFHAVPVNRRVTLKHRETLTLRYRSLYLSVYLLIYSFTSVHLFILTEMLSLQTRSTICSRCKKKG